jgi:hypothetical protein
MMVSRNKLGESLNLEIDLIPESNSNRLGTNIAPRFITIHNTDNTGLGADARAHAKYVKGQDAQNRKVSWHYTVDDKRCIKHLPINEKGWHAGSSEGNKKSIGIEICMNQGIDQAAANQRAASLAAILMYDLNISLENVVTHQHWTGKECPRLLLNNWDQFKEQIQDIYRSIEPQPEAIAELFADESLFVGHGEEPDAQTSEYVTETATEKLEYPAFCSLPPVPERPLQENIDPNRAFMAIVLSKKWVNRTILHYYFFDNPSNWRGDNIQKNAVRQAFTTWKNVGIGLEFVEVNDPTEAEIRIGFEQNAGSWSYVGRDAVDFDVAKNPQNRTMNFGWDLTTPYGRDTALHEIGHAMGLIHEHQNPKAGIVWNGEKVRRYFAGPPNNWNPQQIENNILNKIAPEAIQGSNWDKDSIMEYWFEAGLIISPPGYENQRLIPKGNLSPIDIDEIRRFYPSTPEVNLELKPYLSAMVDLNSGEQLDFIIYPPETRTYTIQMIGGLDAVIVLFEDINGTDSYIKGNDDSGFDKNAQIITRLVKERIYKLRLRVSYTGATGKGAVILL